MCGIFGYLNYGNKVKDKDLQDVLKSLSYESAVRGTDATGVAFVNNKGSIEIQKAPKSAYSFKTKMPDKMPRTVIGHTRHTTQGSEKQNANNHPFHGKASNTRFALAHNGILFNDSELRMEYRLPASKIQTDSYAAVQLIEKEKVLNMASLKKMAESVQGSFVFTLLDSFNSLFIVKGDNPITIIHNKRLELYLYASTDKILATGLSRSTLYSDFLPTKRNVDGIEYICLDDGEILKIDTNGKVSTGSFECNNLSMYNGFYDWRFWNRRSRTTTIECFSSDVQSDDDLIDYIHHLKGMAKSMGYEEDMIDWLLDEGLTLDEIEEYLYQGIYY